MEDTFDFLNEGVLKVEQDMWTMYIDGVLNQKGFKSRHFHPSVLRGGTHPNLY